MGTVEPIFLLHTQHLNEVNMIAKKFMKICFVLCIFIYANAYGESSSLCSPNEKIFFSCHIGKKIVSYCESKVDGADKYLEYRYGKPNKIELSYKGGASDSSNKFNKAEVLGASNGGTEIWFKNNETYYVLSDPVRGWPYLELYKNGSSLARLPCNNVQGHIEGNTDDSSSSINVKTQEDFFSEVLNIKR